MSHSFRLASILCCVLILALTTAEVLLRIAGVRFLLSYEYSGFLLAALVFFALPAATRDDEHITVVKPRAGAQDWLSRARRGFSVGLTVVYLVLLAYICGQLALSSYQDGARSQGIMLTPLYIPQISMVIGMAVAALVLLLRILGRRRSSAQETPSS